VANPLRSEQDAFRFVLLTIGYFALIVIGSAIDVWVGVAVFVLLTAGIVWLVVSRGRRRAR
jgi:Flp pilus assembly protein TadB